MTPERWQQIERLLELALERKPEERADFLDKACSGDEDLRREAEALLEVHGQAESFIEAPALEAVAQTTQVRHARLIAGQQIGSYKILALLGVGGMGEVYRAKDTRIGREVAIKVLPSTYSADPDRLHRFEQEARAAGRLNHPNVLVIYDVGRHEGSPYLVSELLEGETLRDRQGGKSLPLRKAIDYGLQIARGLAAAHEKGIVHRDLKPENLFITKDGRVKILDFGLAKLQPKRGQVTETDVSTQIPSTEPGLILGTLGYMSPEQVRGEPADHGSDIFAFGAILYEMLSGRRAFQGKSPIETMSAILREEPPELLKTTGQIPKALEHIVRHCLEKTPEQRFQSARDLAFDLEELLSSTSSTTELQRALPERLQRRERFAWIVAGTCLLTLVAVLFFARTYLRRPNVDLRAIRFTVNPPEKGTFGGSLTLSPDGHWLTFVASMADGKPSLWLRALDSLKSQSLHGTEGAIYPFWSPDSRFIGFFAQGKLKKIEISGGRPQVLCDAPFPLGGTWNREGVIVFAPNYLDPLYRVSPAGGEPTPVTTVDRKHQETHLWPHFLPDGRHFFYVSWNTLGIPRDSVIRLGSLDSKDLRDYFLLAGSYSNVAYTAQGYLFFAREGTLFGQRFDPVRLQVAGEPIPLGENVASTGWYNYYDFSVSENSVAYRTANPSISQLAWFDQKGKSLGAIAQPGLYSDPWLSPDEKQAAVSLGDPEADVGDIWLIDLLRGTSLRFTFEPKYEACPLWSPDGSRIVFASNRTGYVDLYQKVSSGASNDEILLKTSDSKLAFDWSLDGKFIIYGSVLPKTKIDLWVLPMFGDRQPRLFLQTEFNEKQGRFSPDGKWMAYASDESGKYEIYVQPFPATGGKWQISTNGGEQPSWRRDGKELYYVAGDKKLIAVTVEPDSLSFRASTPKELFQMHVGSDFGRNQYAVTADGQRFLVNTLVGETASPQITVMVNWAAGLKR